MANDISWVQKAFEAATDRSTAALPPEEKMKLIQILLDAYAESDAQGTQPYGIKRAELQKAVIDILDTQSHTPEFKRRIDAALGNIAANDGRNPAPALSFLAYWDRLSKGQRKDFIEGAVELMEKSIKQEFPFLKQLSIGTKFHRISMLVPSDPFTGEADFKTVPMVVSPVSVMGAWEIGVNTFKENGFENGMLLMQETAKAGIHIIQHQLRYTQMMGRFNASMIMPYQLYEDAENIYALQSLSFPPLEGLRRDVHESVFLNKYASERSREFGEAVQGMIEERKPQLHLPPKDGIVSRIAYALRLKR